MATEIQFQSNLNILNDSKEIDLLETVSRVAASSLAKGSLTTSAFNCVHHHAFNSRKILETLLPVRMWS